MNTTKTTRNLNMHRALPVPRVERRFRWTGCPHFRSGLQGRDFSRKRAGEEGRVSRYVRGAKSAAWTFLASLEPRHPWDADAVRGEFVQAKRSIPPVSLPSKGRRCRPLRRRKHCVPSDFLSARIDLSPLWLSAMDGILETRRLGSLNIKRTFHISAFPCS